MSRSLAAESSGYNFAYTYATIVDGRCISITGVDVTDKLRWFDDSLPWEEISQ